MQFQSDTKHFSTSRGCKSASHKIMKKFSCLLGVRRTKVKIINIFPAPLAARMYSISLESPVQPISDGNLVAGQESGSTFKV